jgi:hypothetical protein
MSSNNIGYLIFDKVESSYLARNGVGFTWTSQKNKAAILNQEQSNFWYRQLIQIKQRTSFSILMVDLAVKS